MFMYINYLYTVPYYILIIIIIIVLLDVLSLLKLNNYYDTNYSFGGEQCLGHSVQDKHIHIYISLLQCVCVGMCISDCNITM